MAEPRAVERIWYGEGALAAAARMVLAPLELAYAGAVSIRGAMYDAGMLASRLPRLPAVSVGNLTVGGTGKTPFAAWLAGELAARGASPAVILRGYGGDEPIVHRRLNPGLPVIADPDRLAAIERAAAQGANIAVLDDAFQHRRARRVADVVLVSADRWSSTRRLLPAGPWREPLRALGRASLVLITRKACSVARAEAVRTAVGRAAPAVPAAVAHLAPGELRDAHDARTTALEALTGQRVLAISAVGDPRAFEAQLSELGAVVRGASFPDHHRFSAADAEHLSRGMGEGERAVCTLKDAVKLAPLWPRAGPALWYVSQQLLIDSGGAAIEDLLSALIAASHPPP